MLGAEFDGLRQLYYVETAGVSPLTVRDVGQEGGTERPEGDSVQNNDVGTAERRLSQLAENMAEIIAQSPSVDRAALHDYALSLVRDFFPVSPSIDGDAEVREDDTDALVGSATHSSNAATLLGYGALFVPVGALLGIVFPPLGVSLVFGGVVMILLGVVTAVVTRLTGRGTLQAHTDR